MSSMQLYIDIVRRYSCATTEDVLDIKLLKVGDSVSFTYTPGSKIRQLVKSTVDGIQTRSGRKIRFSVRSDYETVNVWRWK